MHWRPKRKERYKRWCEENVSNQLTVVNEVILNYSNLFLIFLFSSPLHRHCDMITNRFTKKKTFRCLFNVLSIYKWIPVTPVKIEISLECANICHLNRIQISNKRNVPFGQIAVSNTTLAQQLFLQLDDDISVTDLIFLPCIIWLVFSFLLLPPSLHLSFTLAFPVH